MEYAGGRPSDVVRGRPAGALFALIPATPAEP
jgi:hypothetical protein